MAWTVVAFVPDLMDRSRLSGIDGVSFVASPAALVEAASTADLVVVDLGRPRVLEVLPSITSLAPRVIAFGSHVDEELLAAARRAGCREVLPRSKFFARAHELLAAPT
jgi:DNA-binding NarL/FixJ family response regulator